MITRSRKEMPSRHCNTSRIILHRRRLVDSKIDQIKQIKVAL